MGKDVCVCMRKRESDQPFNLVVVFEKFFISKFPTKKVFCSCVPVGKQEGDFIFFGWISHSCIPKPTFDTLQAENRISSGYARGKQNTGLEDLLRHITLPFPGQGMKARHVNPLSMCWGCVSPHCTLHQVTFSSESNGLRLLRV